ncbi:MAG TPA: ATP-binding protein [Pyrinomonadaceae bacterium]|nr:ATP-binding protein [Pyrinomonadaceae bacterium]
MTRWLAEWPPRVVARLPIKVHTKLLAAFLAIVMLLIALGAVSLQVLSRSNLRAKELVEFQRKIAAYRQLQHDTTAQLYSVASALLITDERTLDATLRQLKQFVYNVERLQFVAKDEVELLGQVRNDYHQFIRAVTHAIELIRAGKMTEQHEFQLTQAHNLAERFERLMNQLVNRAEADMVDSIHVIEAAYTHSRWIVIGFAAGSIVLALVLGYAISWSLIGPVQQMDARFEEIASRNFSQPIEVFNRDELGSLAAHLNRMSEQLGQLYQQLETANRHKSDFLASMSHEFRTPLNAIIGYGRLIRRETEGQIAPLQKENLEDLLNNAERLLNLIDSLLDFAKIEAGKMEVRLEAVRVDEVIRGAASTIESMLNPRSVRLISEISTNIPPLNTDREKLRQIILNLLGNAAKFTEQGEIRISASPQNGTLKLVVSDTGIGIEKKDLDQIFEKFHQGDLSTIRKYRGTGLGLAIVKKFVNVLGGEVSVQSEVGEGSTFTVTVPFAAPAQQKEQRA